MKDSDGQVQRIFLKKDDAATQPSLNAAQIIIKTHTETIKIKVHPYFTPKKIMKQHQLYSVKCFWMHL